MRAKRKRRRQRGKLLACSIGLLAVLSLSALVGAETRKYYSETQPTIAETIIQNNIKIRPETIKFLWHERRIIGKRNTAQLILTVLLSYLF